MRNLQRRSLASVYLVMRWLQIRFDFDSTGVRRVFDCLSKGHSGYNDITRTAVQQPGRDGATENAGQENDGQENDGQKCRAGKCRTGK